MTYDKIILGAGLYGLYAAQKCGAAGQRVLVLERDPAPFMRKSIVSHLKIPLFLFLEVYFLVCKFVFILYSFFI